MRMLLALSLAASPSWAQEPDHAASHAAPLDAFDANVALGLVPDGRTFAVRWRVGHPLSGLPGGCVTTRRWGRTAWSTVRCPPTASPRTQLRHLSEHPAVDWAQAAFPIKPSVQPDDLTDDQWHHHNTGQPISGSDGTPGADIGSPEAWELGTGAAAPVVAVIDSGVYREHTDLVGRIYKPPREICDNALDDDENGYVDDCGGWDVGDDDNDPDPRNLPDRMDSGAPCAPFHGTFIAGLIAATAENETGIAGVVWQGSIMPIKIASDDGCRLTDVGLAEAVTYAVDNGAPILNTSFTFTGSSSALDAAFAKADQAGTIVTMSSGNSGIDIDDGTLYPPDYGVENQIVVAATDNRDSLASFSNVGATKVDLAAPGRALTSLALTDSDATMSASGTSFSAPLVAGAAALIWDNYPMLRPGEVVAAILDGAEPIDALSCELNEACVRTGARLYLPGALDEAAWWASTAFPSAGVQVNDLVGGDGDGVLERGETAVLNVVVNNSGHGPTGMLSAEVSITHPIIGTTATVEVPPVGPRSKAVGTTGISLTAPLSCAGNDQATITVDLIDAVIPQTWSWAGSIDVRCDVDEDGDGARYPDDCNDRDPTIAPGAEELCNGVDDDCNEVVDDSSTQGNTWWRDGDGDGWGGATSQVACVAPDGFVGRPGDCDDADADAFPDNGKLDANCARTCGCSSGAGGSAAPLALALLALLTLRSRSYRRSGTSADHRVEPR